MPRCLVSFTLERQTSCGVAAGSHVCGWFSKFGSQRQAISADGSLQYIDVPIVSIKISNMLILGCLDKPVRSFSSGSADQFDRRSPSESTARPLGIFKVYTHSAGNQPHDKNRPPPTTTHNRVLFHLHGGIQSGEHCSAGPSSMNQSAQEHPTP